MFDMSIVFSIVSSISITIIILMFRRESSVWFLLLAFASHKWVISSCLGLKWARSAVGIEHFCLFLHHCHQLKPLVAILYMTVFCAVSPIGEF